MLTNPLVSVVIPTFNRAKELPRSIRSVLSQTVRDLELIIVDDASSDDTEIIVASFDDNRIRYEKLAQNVGGAEARNVGIRMARAEIVAFQDSDDEWTCSKLEQALSALDSDKDVGAVFTSFIQLRGDTCRLMPVGRHKLRKENFYQSLLWQNYVGTPTLVVKKKYLDEVGGFTTSMPRYQDWDLALKLAQVTTLKYLREPTLLSYVTTGSISQNEGARRVALERLYEVHKDRIVCQKALKAAWLHRFGDAQIRSGIMDGRMLLFHAIKCRPLNLRYWVKLLFSIFGCSTYIKLCNAFNNGR